MTLENDNVRFVGVVFVCIVVFISGIFFIYLMMSGSILEMGKITKEVEIHTVTNVEFYKEGWGYLGDGDISITKYFVETENNERFSAWIDGIQIGQKYRMNITSFHNKDSVWRHISNCYKI